MSPKPIEDIEWPDLGDKFLDLLYALWTLVVNVCVVLWSCVADVVDAAWTYPPFEAFRNEFVAALIALMDYVVDHPVTATAIFVLLFIVIPVVLNGLWISLLYCTGSSERRALRGSHATNYQSTSYGGNVPRSWTFVRSQSHLAKGGGGCNAAGGSSSWP